MEFENRSSCDSEEECDQNSSLDPVSAESILMMELGVKLFSALVLKKVREE